MPPVTTFFYFNPVPLYLPLLITIHPKGGGSPLYSERETNDDVHSLKENEGNGRKGEGNGEREGEWFQLETRTNTHKNESEH